MRNAITTRPAVGLLVTGVLTLCCPLLGLDVVVFGLIGGAAIIAGGALLAGGADATAWVHRGAIFSLAAAGVGAAIALIFQPVDLTLTELRLEPSWIAAIAAPFAVAIAISLWAVWMLGGPRARAAIDAARIWHPGAQLAAQAGMGVALLAGFLFWTPLHGQSADLAEQLAQQQLGVGYQYHLSRITTADNGHGRTVSGTVTAWNDKEITTVLIRWETR